MANRPTSSEYARRINEVVKLLLSGLSRAEIMQFIAEKRDWDISERTIDNYIHDANDAIKNNALVDRDLEIGKAIARLENLYARNLQINDFKAALAAQKEINILLGLNAVSRIDITTKGNELPTPQVYLPLVNPYDDSSSESDG